MLANGSSRLWAAGIQCTLESAADVAAPAVLWSFWGDIYHQTIKVAFYSLNKHDCTISGQLFCFPLGSSLFVLEKMDLFFWMFSRLTRPSEVTFQHDPSPDVSLTKQPDASEAVHCRPAGTLVDV